MKRTLLAVCWVSGLAIGCGDDGADTPDTAPEAEVAVEAEVADEVEVTPEIADEVETSAPEVAEETSPEVAEEASPEVHEPLAGFGVITGDCGFVAGELDSAAPSLYVNRIDFGSDPYDDADLAKLTEGGREILRDGNAGGSSILSEVFAYEMLARCEGAVLLKTETEVVYDVAAKITDMIVEIDGKKVGANPTRAIGFPFDAPYTVEQAKTILEKKLGDIKSSSETVSAGDRWVKQILTVFAYADSHVEPVETAWEAIDPALRADTIVIVTVTDGDDAFIY